MTNSLKLHILSPERRLVSDFAVEEVTLPGSEGQIQVLAGHAPMLGTLESGIFSYRTADGSQASGFISTGFFEVREDKVTVLAETLELKGEIDLARARAAQQKAESSLQAAELDQNSFKKYQLKLQRSLIRQQLAGRE